MLDGDVFCIISYNCAILDPIFVREEIHQHKPHHGVHHKFRTSVYHGPGIGYSHPRLGLQDYRNRPHQL